MENTKERILSLLEHVRGDSRSGQQMAEQLGVTRAAVWKAIDQLKKEGHRIEAVNNRGYCLLPESDVLTKSAMEPWLPASYDAGLLHVYSEVDSTNDRAKKLAAQGAPEGTAVVAARQTAGKGRRGRSFFSPEGGVYLSLVLRPALPAEQSTRITTAAAVQVCRVIEQVCGRQPAIKWVNDLLLDGRKICGILTEASLDLETGSPEYVILGVGVNLYSAGFPEELQPIAGALYQKLPQGMTRGRFAAGLLAALLDLSSQCIQPWVIQEYRARCPMVGQTVQIVGSGRQGVVEAITDQCGLRLRFADGTEEEMQSGEVSVRPVKG